MGTTEYFIIIAIPIVITVIFNAVHNEIKNNRTINEQAGYINYLLEENRRLREKLYMDYDPQKLKQEWQEQEPCIPKQSSGKHGRFSG